MRRCSVGFRVDENKLQVIGFGGEFVWIPLSEWEHVFGKECYEKKNITTMVKICWRLIAL